MADNSKNSGTPPSFTFGNAASSSGTSQPSLFAKATASTTAPNTTSLFGNNANTPPGTGAQKPLFGAITSGTTTTPLGEPATAGNLFGKPASMPSNNIFGAPKENKDPVSRDKTPSLFGGSGGTSLAPTTGNIFGNTAQSSAQSAPSLFGNSSAGTNQPSIFGQGTASTAASSGGLFSSANKPSPGGGNLFGAAGQSGATAANQPSGSSTAKQTDSAAAPSLFGKPGKPETSGSATIQNPSLFSATTQSSNQSSAGPLSGFANPAASVTTAAPSSGGLFSNVGKSANTAAASGGLFGGSNSTSTSQAGGLFQGMNNAPPTTTSTTSGSTPSLFGNATAGASTPSLFSGTTSSAPAPSLFPKPTTSGPTPSLFTNSVTTASPAPGSNVSAPVLGGGLFASSQQTPATSQPSTTSQTQPSTSAPLGLFGATTSGSTEPKAAAPASGVATSATTSSAPLFGTTSSATANPTTNTSASLSTNAASSALPTAPPSRLAHKSLDEILTMWSTSLSAHQKSFQDLASRVSTWDRALVENSIRIGSLYGRCFQAERDCAEVERQLTNVEHTQFEIEKALDKYEDEIDRLMGDRSLGDAGGVDAERERTYRSAESCAIRVSELERSLSDMVDEINVTSAKLNSASSKKTSTAAGLEADDPLRGIVRVLNSHLTQLQHIGAGAQGLQDKVKAAQRDARELGRQRGLNGGGEWVDAFGKSYLGRS